jgi:hypothetical protein
MVGTTMRRLGPVRRRFASSTPLPTFAEAWFAAFAGLR